MLLRFLFVLMKRVEMFFLDVEGLPPELLQHIGILVPLLTTLGQLRPLNSSSAKWLPSVPLDCR